MRRRSSPIRHDYIAEVQRPRDSDDGARLPWFAAGVGLPVMLVAAFLFYGDSSSADADDIATDIGNASTTKLPSTSAVSPFATPNDDLATAAPTPVPPVEPDPVIIEPRYEETTLTIARGDTLDQLFRKHSLSIADLLRIAALDAAKQPLKVLRPGDALTITHDAGAIQSLTRHLSLFETLQVTREDDAFTAEVIDRPVEYRRVVRHGRINTSLFEAAKDMGLSDRVVMNVAGIFAWDIDFVYDIRVGDEFFVMYEEIWLDDEKVEDGEIVAAEFVNQGDSYQAVRYIMPDGRSDYFDASGRSVRKAFLRAPVDFKRISSQFNPNRRHPVLNTIRAHRGVDYAAATGTPIMAAGDGKIITRERQRGYGKVVILQHGGNITTLYAHMSNFRKGQKVGSKVRQGQVIGYVGATGLVTGAHLHYEYRLNGVHRNPRTVPLPQAEPIKAALRADFEKSSAPLLQALKAYKEQIQLASVSHAGETSIDAAN